MAYKHYLLGCLAEKPASGYSLHKYLFRPFRRPISQIYRTLNKMVEEGLLESERVVQDKLPNQNVYSLTKKGRAEFDQWLKHLEIVTLGQMDVLGKIWFGVEANKRDIVAHLELFAKQVREQLDYFEPRLNLLEKKAAKDDENSAEIIYRILTIDYTVKQYQVALEWVNSALKRIGNVKPGYSKQELSARSQNTNS